MVKILYRCPGCEEIKVTERAIALEDFATCHKSCQRKFEKKIGDPAKAQQMLNALVSYYRGKVVVKTKLTGGAKRYDALSNPDIRACIEQADKIDLELRYEYLEQVGFPEPNTKEHEAFKNIRVERLNKVSEKSNVLQH